ncbi:MAG: thioredoxin domain-containing protein [Patescibacteria group bacterium]
MEENFAEEISKKWYKKWWGVLILVVGGLILSFTLIIGGQVYYYYRQIKNGKMPLPSQIMFQKSNTATAASGTPDLSKLNPSGEPSTSSTAPFTIVGFFDFECPYSKEAVTAMHEAETLYGDKVNFVFRNFPLTDIHQNSMLAATAGECAHSQGKFWLMSDKIFEGSALSRENFELYAPEIGLDTEQFKKCLDSYQGKGAVLKDVVDGQALGVVGTPTWFINGEKIEGVLSVADFKKVIDFFSAKQTP